MIYLSQLNVQMDNAESLLMIVLPNQFVHLNLPYAQILHVFNHQLDVITTYTITALTINHLNVTINLVLVLH